jgi:hypothetical protein
MESNESFYLRGAECTLLNPDDLGRVATVADELDRISIRGHDRKAVCFCILPNPDIRRESLQPSVNDVKGTWE